MSCRYLVLKTALALCSICSVAISQEEVLDSKITVETSAVLQESKQEETRVAEVNLGKLPVGKKVAVHLTIKNPGDKDIEFASSLSNCACSRFNSKFSVIPAQGQIDTDFSLSTPKRKNDPRVHWEIVLIEKTGKTAVRLTFDYELAGLLAFENSAGAVRFDHSEKAKTLKIPFVATKPILLKDLRVSSSNSFSDLKFEIVSSRSGGVVQARVPGKLVKQGGISGEVVIEHPPTGKKDFHYLTLKHARDCEISPQVIRFTRTDTGLVANSIIRLSDPSNEPGKSEKSDKHAKSDEKDDQTERQFEVTCYLRKQKLGLKVTELSSSIYRIDIELTYDQLVASKEGTNISDNERSVLFWTVVDGKTKSKFVTPYVFENL